MRLTALAAMPLMLFLAACPGPIDLGKDPPPEERMVCDILPDTPQVAALVPFEASNGALVYLKSDVDERDRQIAPYIVELRGAWFSCSNQVGWHRDYWNEGD